MLSKSPRRQCETQAVKIGILALDLWPRRHTFTIDFLRLGEPTDNGHIKPFDLLPREECLNWYWFVSMQVSMQGVEAWRIDYNESDSDLILVDRSALEFAVAEETTLVQFRRKARNS